MTAPEYCATCHNYFPHGQIGDCCHTDADRLRAAATVIRKHSRKPHSFWTHVLTRVLERSAAALERR